MAKLVVMAFVLAGGDPPGRRKATRRWIHLNGAKPILGTEEEVDAGQIGPDGYYRPPPSSLSADAQRLLRKLATRGALRPFDPYEVASAARALRSGPSRRNANIEELVQTGHATNDAVGFWLTALGRLTV